MAHRHTRRRFLEIVGQGATAASLVACGSSSDQRRSAAASPKSVAAPAPSASSVTEAPDAVPRRQLGRTGQEVSCIGLGGFHIGKPDEATAIRLMHAAIDAGIDFFDNCWDYHEGESERRMGKALVDRRDRVFLMSKLDGRTADVASKQIDQSLQRLGTDHIDLMQIHEIIREKDPAWVFGDDGAMRALLDAQKAGKIRFIGFTGHKSPTIHNAMLDAAEEHGVRFDTVQMPLNVMDPHHDSFEKNVLPRLVTDQIGVLGMKPLASGAIIETGLVEPPQCLRYALSLPTSVVITGMEQMRDLEQALAVARGFTPLTQKERSAILARTEKEGRDGDHERFKTSTEFDGTVKNPHWLTTAEV